VRETGPGVSKGTRAPSNFRLRWTCRCLLEWSTGRRQNVFRMQQEPQGSCGSLESRWLPDRSNTPGCRVRSVMVRPDAEGRSTRGEERRRKPLRRSGGDVLRRGLGGSGTTAVEPGRMGSSVFESAELSTSYSSEFEAVEHRRRKDAGVRQRTTAPPLERASRARTPGAAADLACPRGRREINPLWGRKTPRTDRAG
jgi:hypothetical protein